MAFKEVLVTVRGDKITAATISYRRNKRAKTKGPPNLIIGIPSSIAAGSVTDGDCYQMLLGDGADAGRARIVRCADGGGPRAHVLRGSVTFRFGHVPSLGPDAADKETLSVERIDDGFELELPKWFNGRG